MAIKAARSNDMTSWTRRMVKGLRRIEKEELSSVYRYDLELLDRIERAKRYLMKRTRRLGVKKSSHPEQ